IKNHPGFSILGEKLGPFEKGKKYKLKFFLAVPFIKNNILKVASESKCDNVDLQRYAIEERDDQKLIQRENEYFLNKIKEFHLFLEKDVIENNKPQKFLDDYKSYHTSVLDSRLLKIMRMAKSDLSVEVEKRLAASEHLLYNNINKIVNIWREFFLNLTRIKE
ncbi:MAG: hypothetical protein ACFFDK_18050, partial [Promethearchaeota archaeon]